jgi:hypothetical protein
MYTIEHIVATFFLGLVVGVISTLVFSRNGLTLEKWVAIIIMAVWLCMHVYSFLFGNEVDWIFNLVGFGAVGTFVGVNVRNLAPSELVKIIRK